MVFGGTLSRTLPRLTMCAVIVLLLWLTLTSVGAGTAGATAAAGGSYGWVLAVLAGTFTALGVVFLAVGVRR